MIVGIFLINIGFFVGTLWLPLPVSAELVVDQVEGSQVSPFSPRKFLHDFLHVLLIHPFTQVGFLLSCRRAGHDIGLLNLPANIRGTIHGLTRKWGSGEVFGSPIVKAHCILCGSIAFVTAAGLIFGINSLAK